MKQKAWCVASCVSVSVQLATATATDAAGAGAGAGVDLGLGIDFMLTLQYFLNENKQKMPLQLPLELPLGRRRQLSTIGSNRRHKVRVINIIGLAQKAWPGLDWPHTSLVEMCAAR